MLASYWPADVLAELQAGAGTMVTTRLASNGRTGPWVELVTILEQAGRLASTPARPSADVPTSWYLYEDATEPLSVFVIPDDGTPGYQSTVVPPGCSFRVPALAHTGSGTAHLWSRPVVPTSCGCLEDEAPR